MNLFRKSTATVALVTLVSGIFSTGVSAYSNKEVEAANYLASQGIINNHTANPAGYNLDQNVLRQEIAAVARGVAGLSKKDSCDNVFSDVSATTPNDWACYSVEALADADLIAKNAQFRPEANITKAEAVGMMVKAAFRDDYMFDSSKGTSWQEQVVAYAAMNGVVPSFTNYDTPATRGFVFEAGAAALMAIDEEDEDDILAGLLDGLLNGGSTDEEDEDTTSTDNGNDVVTTPVVTGGNVEVTLNPASAKSGTQIPNNGTVRFARVDFTAGSADVSVNTIDVKSLGLASVPTSTRIWFEKNGKRLSGKAAFSSDRTAVVSFAPALVVKAGSTETLELFVELDTLSGNDFQFSGSISSSSANASGSFTTASLRTADYTVVETRFNRVGSSTTYNQSNDVVELGRFTLQNFKPSWVNETRDIAFETVTLRQLGNWDLLDLVNLHVERNGVKVSTETIVNAKDVTFVLNDEIKDASTATYYLKATVASVQNNTGDTYQFSLRNTSDLSSIEKLNGFRSTVVNGGNLTLNTYTIQGADLVFSRDSSIDLSANYAKGTDNVTLLKGTVTSKTAVTLEDVTLSYTINSTLNTWANQLFDTVYLRVGSSVMTWSATATGAAQFLWLATVNGTAEVEMYAKLRDNAPSNTVRFEDLRLSSFAKAEYVSNQNDVNSSVGSISAVNVSVEATGLSITRTDGLGNTTLAVGSKNVLLYGLDLRVTQGNPVSISNAEFSVSWSNVSTSTWHLNNVFATLYVDGQAVSTRTINGSTVKFEWLSKVVGSTATKLEVRADLSDAFATGTLQLQLTSLDITDTLTSSVVSLATIPNSAQFTVAQAVGTLSSSDNNPKRSLLLAGDRDQKVLAFRVRAQNDNVRLRDLTFTGTNLSYLSNFRVVTENGSEVASATTTTSTGVTFTNINTTDIINMDQTKTYYLVADINTNVVGESFEITLVAANSNIRSSNGTNVVITGATTVVSNNHLVNEDKAVVAKSTNSSKNLTTSALRFSVTASGKDSVTLTGATFSNLFSGYNTGSWRLVVYKDSISSNNKLGETTAGTVTGNVTFTANNTVDNGSTNNYIVVIEDIVVDPSANSQDWSLSLSNVMFGGISANVYDNLGDFPITEVR